MGKEGIEHKRRKLDTRPLLPALTEEGSPKAQDQRWSPSTVQPSACTPDLETWFKGDVKPKKMKRWCNKLHYKALQKYRLCINMNKINWITII